jgi:hypothetical protein
MTLWALDTEFDEDGKTIELISIGLVSSEGHEYYAVSREFDPLHCNDWVKKNVLTKLPPPGDPLWKPRAQIAQELIEVTKLGTTVPKFWGYYADYDWVVLCQLYGKMIDLPPGWPMYCRDLKQRMDDFNVDRQDLPGQAPDTEHTAIEDARWVLSGLLWMDRFCR